MFPADFNLNLESMMKRSLIVVLLMSVLAGCASVDETEWCVKTRYGTILEQNVPTGLHATWLVFDFTCFDMTERTYPSEGDDVEVIEAQTADPLTVDGDVTVVVRLDEDRMAETFQAKRTPDRIDREIRDAIRSGYRDAMAGWYVNEIFSDRRPELSDSIQARIQEKLEGLGDVLRIHVRDIKAPGAIENARIEAAKQENLYIQAQRAAQIDSVNAWADVQKAMAEAERERLNAQAYEENPALLTLRANEAIATGLSQMCQGVQTCIIGASALDDFLSRGGAR